jgi:hypothetical protein
VKNTLLIILIIHGLIHLLGFTKAFDIGSANLPGQNISESNGILWLITALLFMSSAVIFFLDKNSRLVLSAVALLISQYLVFMNWHDARFGTIANVIILGAIIISYWTWHFNRKYTDEVKAELRLSASVPDSLLTETDISHLPIPVIKYLRYTGVVGKPKIRNFKVEFVGRIRDKTQSEWMPFTSEQYNFVDSSTRLFFMKATMKHLPIAGFHCFKNGRAFMDIRLLSMFRVQYQSGKEMDVSETVTFFNDMCCLAPATLVDKRIKWLETYKDRVKAEFTNNRITISAWLYFNDAGELINFISHDRYAVANNNTIQRLPWSTPLKNYKQFNRYQLMSYGDAIYTYPDGDFCYGEFRIKSIQYNCKQID